MSKIAELFGVSTSAKKYTKWNALIREQQCPYLERTCIKVRKSQPHISIGTCTVIYGREKQPVIICPFRLLQQKQIFIDCLHLLTLHEPGNELHVVPEISIPGGSVDYFLVSVRDGKIKDFVGIELQTLDTTGTVWPERQRFVDELGIRVTSDDVDSTKTFGMNWKMTAKTILIQLHHKIVTFEHINKHLVLVVQDCLLDYLQKEFQFDHIKAARLGDSMHFHSYQMNQGKCGLWSLGLDSRLSTGSDGISICLGLQAEAKVELESIVRQLQEKVSKSSILKIGSTNSSEYPK